MGAEERLVDKVLAWHAENSGFSPQHCIELGMLENICNPSILEMEERGSKV